MATWIAAAVVNPLTRMSDKIQANFPTFKTAHKSWNIPAMPAMVVTMATESYLQSGSSSVEQSVLATTNDPVKQKSKILG